MKTVGILLTIVFSIILVADTINTVIGHFDYTRQYASHWELAVKASSIPKKLEGVDRFVNALENSNMQGQHDALFLKTPNNGFNENLEALKSLQIRLHEIHDMDVSSFQYQTALAQITQQEQNEASQMLNVFEGIWWKQNHLMLWDWVGFINVFGSIALFGLGMILWGNADY